MSTTASMAKRSFLESLSMAGQPPAALALSVPKPVDPKPPAPRALASRSELTVQATRACAATTICAMRSEEHTSELQSLMRISYAVFCLKKKKAITYTHYCRNDSKQHTRTSLTNTINK